MLENYPIQGKLEAIKLEQHLPPQHLIPKNHAAVQHIFLKKKKGNADATPSLET